MSDERIDLVASVGPLDGVVVLLRELLHRSSAVRAIAALAGRDGDEPAVVDVGRLAPIAVEVGGRTVHLPHAAPLDAGPPGALPEFRDLPPFDADPISGEIAAPLGGVEHYARATRDAAALLSGADVLQLQWESTRPGVPFSITARADGEEPLVLGVGDEAFPMPPGWPDVPIPG